jgi:uncharacterized membrane protein YkoI
MAFRKFLTAGLAAALALGIAGGAVAQNTKSTNSPPAKSAVAVRASLVSAIATAEQRTGGRALKIRAEHEKGVPVYEVKLAAKGKLLIVFVKAADGKVIKTEDEGRLDKAMDRDDRSEVAKFLAAPTTLGAAIKVAVQRTGGKAIKAAYENEDDKTRIEVKTMNGKVLRSVKIDAATGKIIKVRHEDRDIDHEHEED